MDTPTPGAVPDPSAAVPPAGTKPAGGTRIAWIVVAVVAIVLLALLLSRCQVQPIQTTTKKAPVAAGTTKSLPATEAPASELVTRTDGGTFNGASAGGTKNQLPNSKVTVPDVVGLSLTAARSKVEARGLRFYPIPRPMGSKNQVWQQNPAPGTVVDGGSDVQVLYGGK